MRFLILAYGICEIGLLLANPTDGIVISGQASFHEEGSTLQVNVDAQSVIEWHDFSIASSEVVRFVQPSVEAAVLNKVVGPCISEIMGRLEANGKVYLINPSGIIVGPQGVVQTASFIASTLDLSIEDFLKGDHLSFTGDSKASLVNLGTIRSEIGDVILLARVVDQNGLIETAGDLHIATGSEILIQMEKQKGVKIIPSKKEGMVSLQGKIKGNPYAAAINHEETSSCVTQSNGKYFIGIQTERMLMASDSKIEGDEIAISAEESFIQTLNSEINAKKIEVIVPKGRLFASGRFHVDGEEGKISLSGDSVALVGARVDANGIGKGGEIYIGGGLQGNDPSIMNAHEVYLSPSTTLKSNSIEGENGGVIVVFAEGKVTTEANISSRGGFVELSGKESLSNQSQLDIGRGSFLIDPKNITFTASSGVFPQLLLVDPDPTGGGTFNNVTSLDNGNVAVVNSSRTIGGQSGAGALYLYEGTTLALISTLTGSNVDDLVGDERVTKLSDGNIVLISSRWNNLRGAVTWINGTTGLSGVISASNSLVGGTDGDLVGSAVTVLPNGNFVVSSPGWINSGNVNAGAATWSDGTVVGPVTASNSLVGTLANDQVSSNSVVVLNNGNYVVRSGPWNSTRGAVTFGVNSSVGKAVGAVSASNSLVGGSVGDYVGATTDCVVRVGNNYVVRSPLWKNGSNSDAGAVTWGSGTTGVSGAISSSNSLVGTHADDSVGYGITVLTNNNYVVQTPSWNQSRGAATWGSGTTGVTGAVSSSNSLTGTLAFDNVGNKIIALPNGNYVVESFQCSIAGHTQAGAVTWGDGTTGVVGAVSTSNSLYGTQDNDRIGYAAVVALTNSNYVVASPYYSGFVSDGGAVTLCPGNTSTAVAVSNSNSLIGFRAGSELGSGGIYPVGSHNAAVRSPDCRPQNALTAGAVTWIDGTNPLVGATVSTANSLYGSVVGDRIGSGGITVLTNGNYVVQSPNCSIINGIVFQSNAGAATWIDGNTGLAHLASSRGIAVSLANSLVGTNSSDRVGTVVIALTNGDYVVESEDWEGGLGAITWCSGDGSTVGRVSETNSIVGQSTNDQIGSGGIVPLSGGGYAIVSPEWTSNLSTGTTTTTTVSLGAVSSGIGPSGPNVGVISAANSIVGTDYGDSVGSGGIVPLDGNNYVISSPFWNGEGAYTWVSGTLGTVGEISTENSVINVSAQYGSSQITPVPNAVESTYYLPFQNQVIQGFYNPAQVAFDQGTSQDMAIYPLALTDLINAGATGILQASNDVTFSDPLSINEAGAGSLSVLAGRSILVNANISLGSNNLTMTANAPASDGVVDGDRDIGNATLSIANGVNITTTGGDVTLTLSDGAGNTNSDSSDLVLGDSIVITAGGSGEITLNATSHNVTMGNDCTLTTNSGNLLIEAGENISGGTNTIIQSTSGNISLVVDTLYPTSPSYGTGAFNLLDATLTTSGNLQLYASQASLDSLPTTMNGAAFPNPTYTEYGVYYDNGVGGVPYKIFYKTGAPPPPPSPSPLPIQVTLSDRSVAQYLIGNSDALYSWRTNPFRPLFNTQSRLFFEWHNKPELWYYIKSFWIMQIGSQDIYE